MQRREFSRLSALLAGLTVLGPNALLAGVSASWPGRDEKPWLLGFRGVDRDAYQSRPQVTGRIPANLIGTLYRNGPAQHEVAGFRYGHWFDGDGMVHAYRITPQGISHQARLVGTRKLTRERAAGRALYPGFGSAPSQTANVFSPDDVNTANISVLFHANKLLALWEAGSPYELDPVTLETRGLYAFSEETQGAPFSAHPRLDADGSLWNFSSLSAQGSIVLWHIDPRGKVLKVGAIKVDPITMPHDFIVTQNHLVILLPPLHFQPGSAATNFLDAHTWAGQDATRVLVIDKNNFDRHKWLELPAQWVFHFGNGWEDDQGVIRFDGHRYHDAKLLLESFKNIMDGSVETLTEHVGHRVHYRIDTKTGQTSEASALPSSMRSEFPTVDPRVSGQRNARVIFLSTDLDKTPDTVWFNRVSTFNEETGDHQFFTYPATVFPEEHLYVPDPSKAAECGGWVLGTALDWQHQRHQLNIFDADRLAEGPVASARLPYPLPIGLHGKFVPG